jgi:hypothetical protein
MTQYHVLASERQQRYSIYTKTPRKYRGKKERGLYCCIISLFNEEPLILPLSETNDQCVLFNSVRMGRGIQANNLRNLRRKGNMLLYIQSFKKLFE